METNCAYWNDNEDAVVEAVPCMCCVECAKALEAARHDTAADLALMEALAVPTFCDFWAKELENAGRRGTMCASCAMCEVARLGVDGISPSEAEVSALALALEERVSTVRGVWQ